MDDSDQPARPLFMFGPGMRAMLLVALCFACMGIYELLVYLIPMQINNLRVQTPELFILFTDVLVFALPALIYVNVFPLERFGYFRLNKPVPLLTVLFGALTLVLFIPVIWFGATAIQNSITNPELLNYLEDLRKANEGSTPMPTIGSLFVWLFVSGLVTAVCEELFFRAGLQQILSEHSANKHFPIIITALLFTLFHASLVALPFIFIAGLLLGYAFQRTGSLRTTIAMHFLFNGTSLFIEYQAQHHLSVRLWEPGVLVTSVCALGAAACFFMFWKKTENTGNF